MSHYCIACDDLAHGREPSRPHQGCAEIGKNGASPAPSASPATQRTIPEPQIHPQPPFPAVGKRAAPASPATEDEALVDAFDEAAVACQAAADLASATALSERKETARVSLLSHLTALRRRAEEAAEEFTRYRNEREPHYRKIAEDAQRETASLRAEVAALRQERDDARFDGANARAEVERLRAVRPPAESSRPAITRRTAGAGSATRIGRTCAAPSRASTRCLGAEIRALASPSPKKED